MGKKVQSYTTEFRAEAVKLVLAQGLTLQEASQRISVPKGTLANWVASARGGKPVGAPGARTVAELEGENKTVPEGIGANAYGTGYRKKPPSRVSASL
ncbi:transposase [Acidithiobacillus sp.]|jgi:transposase|uniref:transposase n=1 Tax=Acidithiobacillus sp. TaxID=1872118 RepID=UPI003561DA47